MKNITLKIDDETHRQARILAAQRGTSISALVRNFLIESTTKAASHEQSDDSLSSHEKRIADLDAFFAMLDAKAKTRPPRTEPLKPMTREEIYAERIH
jgi:plasmid stability protein